MVQNFKYSLSELNDMMPWEREIYLTLLNEYLKKQEEEQKQVRTDTIQTISGSQTFIHVFVGVFLPPTIWLKENALKA